MKSPSKSLFQRHPKKTLIATILIGFVTIDLLAGFILVPKSVLYKCPHHYYHHDHLPNQAMNDIWGDRKYPVFTNSLGFRDFANTQVSLKPGKKRIIFMGDSFTKGEGVAYENSFAGLITRSADVARLEILNAAASSYSPKLYY